MGQFYFFCLVGGLGFICDYAIFLTLNLFLNTYFAKIIGFFFFFFLTYALNKWLTFSARKASYSVYILGQTKGFLINILIFSAVYSYTKSQNISFLIASGTTLVFNFYYAKYFAFKAKTGDL